MKINKGYIIGGGWIIDVELGIGYKIEKIDKENGEVKLKTAFKLRPEIEYKIPTPIGVIRKSLELIKKI